MAQTPGEPVVAGPVECDDRCDDLDFNAFDPFDTVLAAEYEEVHRRRGREGASGRPADLAGIALSGGGIRSATFNLGLLQSLNRAGLLQQFDYLSTVSGGGYCGGWWSAWLSRGTRGTREFFPDDERIELERHDMRHERSVGMANAGEEYSDASESAMNAGSDPIHHLRLFSNFLTPRKGLLSSDTWRAITAIGRNLVLTWLILLPLLLAAILAGQSWFVLVTGSDFEHRVVVNKDVDTSAESAAESQVARQAQIANVETERPRAERLEERLFMALLPSAFLFVGGVLCVLLWMVFTRKCWKVRDIVIVALTFIAFTGLTLIALLVTPVLPTTPRVWQFLGIAAALTVALLIGLGIRSRLAHGKVDDTAFWRNQIANIQTRLLQWSVLLAVVLLFAAFGHEAIDFLLYDTDLHRTVAARVAKAGGWTAVILSLLGAAYTAVKGAPSGGDAAKKKKPKFFQRVVFTSVPPLMLFVLALFLSWVGHRWYSAVYTDAEVEFWNNYGEIWWITVATLISAFLFLSMALYEFRPRSRKGVLVLIGLWAAIVVALRYAPAEKLAQNLFAICVGSAIFIIGALVLRGKRGAILGAAVIGAGVGILIDTADKLEDVKALPITELPYVIVIGILFSITLLLFELILAEGSNTRSFALLGIGFTMLVLVGIAACSPEAYAWRMLAMFGCISTVLGWVLSLGWLLDPNVLTIHAFYKARLVRAYMGASNDERRNAPHADVSEAVPGDDVPLVNLANTHHGAPYHLINTTLNLVGARDLATVQRFSDSFVMSKRYCGSLRTGYRPTSEYACGTMSLGTAVAISGAAASPNMGAQTPSAALAMLLTLFNVRLGYWAPTPNRTHWRAGAARLWPFYTIQELLSQTTDLLPFCYLTDGGHFDNTAVYSLIQRGCRYIIVADCGADPKAAFNDFGELVRKVRIDFGTEITINVDDLREDDNPVLRRGPKSHFAAGTIRYSDVHAQSLGLSGEQQHGILILIKPTLAPGVTADVLQYGYANKEFPQQSTADQWYDEQQFESYRQLGVLSGNALLTNDRRPEIGAFFASLTAPAATPDPQ